DTPGPGCTGDGRERRGSRDDAGRRGHHRRGPAPEARSFAATTAPPRCPQRHAERDVPRRGEWQTDLERPRRAPGAPALFHDDLVTATSVPFVRTTGVPTVPSIPTGWADEQARPRYHDVMTLRHVTTRAWAPACRRTLARARATTSPPGTARCGR